MCKQMNKKKKEEEEEEDEEQDYPSSTLDRPDDQYLQQDGDDEEEEEEEEEVDASNMTPIKSETINRIRRSSSQMESSMVIIDSTQNCSPSRSGSTLTNTESTPSSTKFTIDEILKPDFGICKVRRVRHHRPLQQDLTLLSFQHRPQVISFGPTGSVVIPMSHYATALYSSTSSVAPTPLPSPLPPPPVVVSASGSLSSLSSSSPLLSSSSSSSLVRYGSNSISPSSLGLHHHLQNHHHKQLSSSSSVLHTFKHTRQHHNHQRPHQHSKSHGSMGTYNHNSSNHSHRNHHHHHHFQHPQNRSETSTNQQQAHVSRNQQHRSQQSQHHSSGNSVQKPHSHNPHRNDRDTFNGKSLHFLNPSGTASDLTTKESNSDICSSPPAISFISTAAITTTKSNSNTLNNKRASTNNTASGDPNINSNQPSTNTETATATVYEGAAPFVWPAWVYCTRYSDRPSSGPRSRKIKKRDRSADEKRPRTSFTSDQLQRLKQEFDDCRYLTEERRKELARELCLSEAQIKIWFQNKRAKIKKSSGVKNPLALHLMAQGLYNHSTVSIKGEHFA